MESTIDRIVLWVNSSASGGFPPSFEGNPWVFTGALFCTMLASLLCITQFYNIIKEMVTIPDKWNAPINIYRIQLLLAYMTVWMALTPDAIYLWTFGEVEPTTSSSILLVDRVFDNLFIIPFLFFTAIHWKFSHLLSFQLIRRALPFEMSLPKSKSIKTNIFVTFVLMLMSFGVALSK